MPKKSDDRTMAIRCFCHCTGMHRKHQVGEGDCYGILIPENEAPTSLGHDVWEHQGEVVTGGQLHRKGYTHHVAARRWSKVRGT